MRLGVQSRNIIHIPVKQSGTKWALWILSNKFGVCLCAMPCVLLSLRGCDSIAESVESVLAVGILLRRMIRRSHVDNVMHMEKGW